MTPIATATNRPGKAIRIRGGSGPFAITPNGKTLYVDNNSAVVPISTATNKPGKAIKFRGGALPFVITPNGKTLYVANFLSGTVTPISTATNKPGKPIKVGEYPRHIAITPNGKTVYVSSSPPPVCCGPADRVSPAPAGGSATITPISTATDKPGKAIDIGIAAAYIAITPNSKTAYVSQQLNGLGYVIPISTATNKPGKAIQVGHDPSAIAFTP